MPCRDDSYPTMSIDQGRLDRLKNAEAFLCGVTKALADLGLLGKVISHVDWQEAGVTQDMYAAWRANHEREDAIRKAAEAAKRAHEEARKAALKKLSIADRKALGLDR